ncbi:hypothetical protein BDY17DRAFT_297130 [Neohortaea acidophila]|uniref:Secreted protein n=1 Tax=Neohortaea acidophila TaxID=245834 RepID=A0A6A6PT41_9PEZI|nr:uncharacterized protein BDY17DRAFT_297130 [Neohortaea acidophila]KAF2483269.1 hypothetical protein BDY17DRAFT_297130 [Neohortaea acidophila]
MLHHILMCLAELLPEHHGQLLIFWLCCHTFRVWVMASTNNQNNAPTVPRNPSPPSPNPWWNKHCGDKASCITLTTCLQSASYRRLELSGLSCVLCLIDPCEHRIRRRTVRQYIRRTGHGIEYTQR